jgi:hypothetical protein
MIISRVELDQLIKEEINEIFGFGKEAPKEYPGAELATIIRGLSDASRLSGAELTPKQREAIVDELTAVLKSQGFVIKEQERLYTGEQDILITHENAPKLKVFLDTVAQQNPKIFKQLLGLFNRSALDISAVVKNIIPSITQVGTREPDSREKPESEDDEDLTDTEVDLPPVSVPEEPEEEEEDSNWDKALDGVQASLDVVGAIGLYPPAMIISKPATLASLALNTSRGMYGWALFDLISLTPLFGDAMKAGKMGVKGTKLAKAAKIKKFGAMRTLVKAGQAGNARKAAKAAKGARAGMVLEKGAEGIVELIPEELLQKLINEKTDEGEPMVPWMIETLGNAPGFGDAAPKLLAAWDDVVAAASQADPKITAASSPRPRFGQAGKKLRRPDQIGPLREQKELDRMKVLAGVK